MGAGQQGADHITPMMLFDFTRWKFHFPRRRFHYLSCIKYNRMILHKIAFCLKSITDSSTKHKRLKSRVETDGFPRKSRRLKYFACLGTYVLLWNNMWSVCHYVIGPFGGWWRLGGSGKPSPFQKCMLGIGVHLVDLLPNYTFYTHLTILSIGYFLVKDVKIMWHDTLLKVEKSMQHRLTPA